MNLLNKVILDLEKVRGLSVLGILEKKHRDFINSFEEKNNLGVIECLSRQYTLLLSHDSTFRTPAGNIVKIENNKTIFPPVSFPEIQAEKVVSASPSEKVHKGLAKMLNLSLPVEKATLLVGFDQIDENAENNNITKSPKDHLEHT